MAEQDDHEQSFDVDVTIRVRLGFSDLVRNGSAGWVPHPAELVKPVLRAVEEALGVGGQDLSVLENTLASGSRRASLPTGGPLVVGVEVLDDSGTCVLAWDCSGLDD